MNTNVLNHFIRVKQEVKEPSFLYWKFIFFNFLIHFFRFLWPVAYRQYVRPVYEYVGTSKRIPLPNCVYNRIRKAFPNADGEYVRYEEEERQD